METNSSGAFRPRRDLLGCVPFEMPRLKCRPSSPAPIRDVRCQFSSGREATVTFPALGRHIVGFAACLSTLFFGDGANSDHPQGGNMTLRALLGFDSYVFNSFGHPHRDASAAGGHEPCVFSVGMTYEKPLHRGPVFVKQAIHRRDSGLVVRSLSSGQHRAQSATTRRRLRCRSLRVGEYRGERLGAQR